jgi:hypothetical protein
MSLLPTPTFSGVAETETFYVRQSAPNVSGVSSVQGIAGAVGITSADTSISVSVSGQNVNLNTTGNPLAPSTVSASGNISGAGLAIAGQATVAGLTTTGGGLAVGPDISILGFNASTSSNDTRPVAGFETYAPVVVPATAVSGTFSSPALNALLNSNGAHLIAFSICSPYVVPAGTDIQAFVQGVFQINASVGNSGGVLLPAQVALRSAGWVYSLVGNGTGGSPFSAIFTASGGATNAGVFTLTQIC